MALGGVLLLKENEAGMARKPSCIMLDYEIERKLSSSAENGGAKMCRSGLVKHRFVVRLRYVAPRHSRHNKAEA